SRSERRHSRFVGCALHAGRITQASWSFLHFVVHRFRLHQSLINGLRTLGAHAYGSEGRPLSREEQLQDSIDTPAIRWGVLWSPTISIATDTLRPVPFAIFEPRSEEHT